MGESLKAGSMGGARVGVFGRQNAEEGKRQRDQNVSYASSQREQAEHL
jgi:hypothetical protein